MDNLEIIMEDNGYIVKFFWLNQFLLVKSVFEKKRPKMLSNRQFSILAGTEACRPRGARWIQEPVS